VTIRGSTAGLADPIDATRADLPLGAIAALDAPPEPVWIAVDAAGILFAARTWGDPGDPPLLLVHGVTSSSRGWWRVGPALAVGLRRHVVAVDQAGHGRTARWTGHHRFRDNAADIAAFVGAAGIGTADLRVVGHSWGAMTAAAMPVAGLRPEVVVLLDPPAVPLAAMNAMLDDPVERHYDDLYEALTAVGALNPTWPFGDILAKAESLTQFDEEGVRAVLTENGDWDGGLADVAESDAAGVAFRLVRGEPAFGGLVPDTAAAAFAERIGPTNVITIARGAHSPMRLRPEGTVFALLHALEPD
jgi:pimeloyl-ACP methyl ester carboxylesterase